MKSSRLIFSVCAVLVLLAGCADAGKAEMREWMEKTKRQTKPHVEKISAPKEFKPFGYSQQGVISPYDPTKLDVAIAKENGGTSSGLKPDFDRRREPLEQNPLDTISMVGFIQKGGVNYAILKVNQMIYRAKAGNYLGKNFGLITEITEDTIYIREIVQDSSGEWIPREAELELQESTK